MGTWSPRWASKNSTWSVLPHVGGKTGTVMQSVERNLVELGDFPIEVARLIVDEHNARIVEIFERPGDNVCACTACEQRQP